MQIEKRPVGVSSMDRLDASTLSGENSAAEWRSGLDPAERNCSGVHLTVGRMRGAFRLVFVFPRRGNPISGTSNKGSEREKFLQQSRDSE